MQIKLLNIKNQCHFAFGLTWRAFDPKQSTHRQILSWKNDGYHWAGSYKINGNEITGLSGNFIFPSLRKPIYCFAALLARSNEHKGRTALFRINVGNGDTAFIGVMNGVVVLDVVRESSAMDEIAHEFLSYFHTVDVTYDLIDDLNLELFIPTQRFFSIHFDDAVLHKFKSDRTQVYVLIFLILFAAAALVKMYLGEREDERKKLDSLRMQTLNNPVYKYGIAVESFLKSENAIAPLSANIEPIHKFLSGLGSISRKGWHLKTLSCSVANESCLFLWSKKPASGALFSDFIEAAEPDWTNISFDENLEELRFSTPFKPVYSSLIPRSNWLTFNDFVYSEGDMWGKYAPLGFKVLLKKPQPQPINPSLSIESIKDAPNVIWASDWEVNRTNLIFLDVLKKTKYANNSLLGFSVFFDGAKELTFTMNGRTYLENK
jgi:hypothetical protein